MLCPWSSAQRTRYETVFRPPSVVMRPLVPARPFVEARPLVSARPFVPASPLVIARPFVIARPLILASPFVPASAYPWVGSALSPVASSGSSPQPTSAAVAAMPRLIQVARPSARRWIFILRPHQGAVSVPTVSDQHRRPNRP